MSQVQFPPPVDAVAAMMKTAADRLEALKARVAELEQRIRYEQARYAELEANLECKSWLLISDVLEAAIILRDLCEAPDVGSPDSGHIVGVRRGGYETYRARAISERGVEVLRLLSGTVDRMEKQDAADRELGVMDGQEPD